MIELSKMLMKNTTLQTLDLYGQEWLIVWNKTNKNDHMLFEIDTKFRNEGAEALLEAIEDNTTLKNLYIQGEFSIN